MFRQTVTQIVCCQTEAAASFVQVLIGTNDNELQQRLLGSGAFSIPAEFLINDIRKVR